MRASGAAVLFKTDNHAIACAADLTVAGHRIVHDHAGVFDRPGARGDGVDFVLIHRRQIVRRKVSHDQLWIVGAVRIRREASGDGVGDADGLEPFQEHDIVDVV